MRKDKCSAKQQGLAKDSLGTDSEAGAEVPFGYQTADAFEYGCMKTCARELRRKPTRSENRLWEYLSRNQLGVHFRRQHIIGIYIVDFVCLHDKLVIEVDGDVHQSSDQQRWDQQRTQFLQKQGFKVIRFTNQQVDNDIETVLSVIIKNLIWQHESKDKQQ